MCLERKRRRQEGLQSGRLFPPIIVVRTDSRLSNRATSGPLHLKFPLHGIRCQSEEVAIKVDKNCSAHRARYYRKYPGLARRLFCCQHIPFNVAIWWMAMPRSQSERTEENNQKKKGKKDPPPDVLLIECLPKSNCTAQPERVLNLPTQEVAGLAARVSDPSVGNSIHEEFHVIIRSDDVRRLQMWVEMYGLQNVANLDLYSYGFSLCQEAIRFYKPSVFHYLISLCTEHQERIFVHRGKRNNNSSPLHLAAYNARDHRLAVKWFAKAAIQGNDDAQYSLATCYQDGVGVERDLAIAFRWFRATGDQGHAEAQNQLGDCYYFPRDFVLAASWFAKAAEQEDTDAIDK